MNKFILFSLTIVLAIALGTIIGNNGNVFAQSKSENTSTVDIKGVTATITNINPSDKGLPQINSVVKYLMDIEKLPNHYFTYTVIDRTTGTTKAFTSQNATAIKDQLMAQANESASKGSLSTLAFTTIGNNWANIDWYVHK